VRKFIQVVRNDFNHCVIQDKQAVEEWKAGIKAQLMRQGLIRGQPRTSLMHTPSPGPVIQSHSRVLPYRHVPSAAGPGPSSLSHVEVDTEFGYRYVDSMRDHLNGHGHNMHSTAMIPAISSESFQIRNLAFFDTSHLGGSNPNFHHRLSISSSSFTFPSLPQVSPPSLLSVSPSTAMVDNFQNFDFSHLVSQGHGHAGGISPFDYDPRPPSPVSSPIQGFSVLSGLNRGEFVIYYFNHVRKLQYTFAGNSVTNATYLLVLQEPQGAVTNAVCALASLHYKRRRVA